MYKCSQVAGLTHAVGGSFLNVTVFHAAVLQNLYCYYHVLLVCIYYGLLYISENMHSFLQAKMHHLVLCTSSMMV